MGDLIQTPIDRPIDRLLERFLEPPMHGAARLTCCSLEGMAPLVRQMGMIGVVDHLTASALSDASVCVVPLDPMIEFDVHFLTSRPLARSRPAQLIVKAMEESLSK